VSALERLWYGQAPAWQRVLASVVLGPPALLFGGAGAVRNALFDAGLLRSHHVEGLQIVSVGNLTVGGSGKTPLVIFLARWALAAGQQVAVLSRGYGRVSREPLDFDVASLPDEARASDEPRLIARRAPGARVFLDADRVAAARRARAAGCTVAILDDGFQHRRLARDVDVAIEVPTASPWVMPLGPGRELVSGRRRASVVWNGQGAADPQGRLIVTGVRDPSGAPVELRGARVVALTGIARPQRFLQTLEALGATVVRHERFADHHRFSEKERASARQHAARLGATLVTTEKDRERLPDGFEIAVVETAIGVTRGLDALARAVGWPSACAPVPSMEKGAP